MLRRIQKLTSAFLIVMMICSMAAPALAKTVKAKVSSSSAQIYRVASTSSSHVSVKKGTKLTVTAVKRGWAKVRCNGKTGYMKTSALSRVKTKKKTSRSWKSKVVALDWFDGGQSVLPVGGYGYIYDIRSGKSIHIKRMGGHNHADVEPASRADTAKLKAISGGYSWDSRPVILAANGKYVACAINTMPHGDQTITNNGYNGQFCLHMVNSKTHGTEKVNESHQSAIRTAYNWAH